MNNLDFQEKIGYYFKNEELLSNALTHSSFINDNNSRFKNNERLEFLGDAFLDAIISEALFEKFPEQSEGGLSKLRASIVCEKSLAAHARKLGVGDMLAMGKGEEKMGGRNRDSILADAMEAIVASIYIDSGYEDTRNFVLGIFDRSINDLVLGKRVTDYKTEMQKFVQEEKKNAHISYVIDREEGPPHDKVFYVSLYLDNEKKGSGAGKTKKEAEQQAAKDAFEKGLYLCTSKE